MKAKRYFYRCVHVVDVNYLAPDHRRERWSGLQAPIVIHSLRMFPEDGLGGKDADYLVTERPLAKHFTTPVTRMVKRKNLRTGEYTMEPVESKVKFELVEPEDMTDAIKRKARSLTLPEGAYDLKVPVEV